MKIKDAVKLLNADTLSENKSMDNYIIRSAFAADLLSDVLALTGDEQATLITGTANMQVIRVAEILDISCIIFVRGKTPEQGILIKAKELGIPLLRTRKTMFETCGILYSHGVSHCRYKNCIENNGMPGGRK